MQEPKVTKKDLPRLCADSVGIAHFLVANALIVVGEFTGLLDDYGSIFPGLMFVYKYVDFPVYYLLEGWLPALSAAKIKILLFGQLVITMSSFLYALVTWIVVYAFMGDD